MTKRKFLSIFYYHLGHNVDRILYMISPTPDWVASKLADLYQWSMWKSVKYDDFYEVWTKVDKKKDLTFTKESCNLKQ